MSLVPQAWIVGQASALEAAVAAVVTCSRTIRHLHTLGEAWQMQLPTPDLVLVSLQHPDEYPPVEVARLLAELPLARIVCACGPWCASIGRTRNTWPHALRIPAEQAAARIRREAQVIAGRLDPLPRTASLDEVFAFDRQPLPDSTPGGPP